MSWRARLGGLLLAWALVAAVTGSVTYLVSPAHRPWEMVGWWVMVIVFGSIGAAAGWTR